MPKFYTIQLHTHFFPLLMKVSNHFYSLPVLVTFTKAGAAEMLRRGFQQWLSTWWEGRANPEDLRCNQCNLRVYATSFKGWQWRQGHLLLEISAYLRPSEGKQLFSFISAATTLELILICCSQELCHPAIIIVLSIPLEHYSNKEGKEHKREDFPIYW